jgi:hypothetical protein
MEYPNRDKKGQNQRNIRKKQMAVNRPGKTMFMMKDILENKGYKSRKIVCKFIFLAISILAIDFSQIYII